MPSDTKRIWVTWENQRRNRTVSRAMDAELYEVLAPGSRFHRYLACLRRTFRIFRSEKPTTIFVQNPSIVLAAFSVLYARLLNINVIVDAHYTGVQPFDNKKAWANLLTKLILMEAHIVIVTNDGDGRRVRKQGGNPFILPDPIPHFGPAPTIPLKGRHSVLFICSWAVDEPYEQVIEAAKLLPSDIYVYVTGDPKRKQVSLGPVPANVVLTGYVDEATYVSLLISCDVVVDLTTYDDCLVCGGYEALSQEKPLLLSDTSALRAYFSHSALYCDNSATDVAEKLLAAIDNAGRLRQSARAISLERQREWVDKKLKLEHQIAALEAKVKYPRDVRR